MVAERSWDSKKLKLAKLSSRMFTFFMCTERSWKLESSESQSAVSGFDLDLPPMTNANTDSPGFDWACHP